VLFYSEPLLYFQPDVLLLAVLWCGLERDFYEGGALTLVFGYLAEIHSAAPKGYFFVVYMTLYLATRLTHRILVLPGRSALTLMVLLASLLSRIVGALTLEALGVEASPWRNLAYYLLPGALAEALLSLWVFRLLERFDWVTFKNPRARQLLEDEMTLE
jgi:cell shape-determining protein MreD